MNLSNLSPEEQNAFQQLFQKASQGDAPSPTMAGQGGATQASQLPQQQPSMGLQMQPGDKMDPNEAMAKISEMMASKATGLQLGQNKRGQDTMKMVPNNPLFRMLGIHKNVPMNEPNYADAAQQAGLTEYLPSGLMRRKDGTPYVTGDAVERAKQLKAMSGKGNPADVPSKEWGEALKSKALEIYGPDSDRFKSFASAVDASGGVPVSKLAEVSSALITPTKQGDIFKGEDGRTYFYDRGSQDAQPILGKVGGVLSSFNPLELGIVRSEMKGFDSDPVVKDARKNIANLTSVSALIESRNPASIGILASNIAKGLGKEAGVLTEGDIARSTGSQQLGDRWKRFWSKHVKGQLSDTDVSDFRQLMMDINRASQKQIENTIQQRSTRLGKVLKRDPKELRDLISYGTEFMSAEEAAPLESKSPFTADRPTGAKQGQTKSGVKYRVIQ